MIRSWRERPPLGDTFEFDYEFVDAGDRVGDERAIADLAAGPIALGMDASAYVARPSGRWGTRAMRRSGGRKGRDPKVERLSQVQLFSACSKRDLSRIAALTEEIEVPAGRVLIRPVAELAGRAVHAALG